MTTDEPEHNHAGPRPFRVITEDETFGASAAFVFAHPGCGDAVKIDRGEWSLVCWCELCKDLRTYQVSDHFYRA